MDINLETAVQYHYGQFPPINLNYASFINPLVKATDAIARYDQMLKNMHNSDVLLAPLRNQEALMSSRMEGTISTMDEILRYEADHEHDTPETSKTRLDVIETILYQRALKAAQLALDKGYPLSQSMMKSIHERLLSWGRGATKSPGEFKIRQNYLTDQSKKKILFVPIRPDNLQDGLDLLFEYINTDASPILIKAAMAHIEFEALHPFQDGNGRIGRMLITLMLWHSGTISAPHFYISSYFEAHKDRYIDMMRQVSATGDWNEWCSFFLEAIEQQAINNLSIAERISSLYETMKQDFPAILSSRWGITALDFIFTNPVFRNNKFTSHSGVPAATAARFTRMLLGEGIIRTVEEASGRRPALYSFEPLMDLIRV